MKDAYLISALDPPRNESGEISTSACNSIIANFCLPAGGTQFKDMNQLLRLLVENEIFRLSVWGNPMNDSKRGSDHTNFTEKGLTDVRTKSVVFSDTR